MAWSLQLLVSRYQDGTEIFGWWSLLYDQLSMRNSLDKPLNLDDTFN